MYPSCSKSSEWHFSRLESWNRRSRLVSNFHISVVTSRQAFEVVTKMIHSNITILFIWKRSKIQIYIHWHWFYVRASPKSTLASKTLLEGNNIRFLGMLKQFYFGLNNKIWISFLSCSKKLNYSWFKSIHKIRMYGFADKPWHFDRSY